MSNNFPHLSDTNFPDLDNIDVYKYQNNFDYNRWKNDTQIHMCNVLWNSDYKDVVKFDTDEIRDNYFDNIINKAVKLQTVFHTPPVDTIKVPIPYGVATKYNYCWVDLPIMTSENEKLNYEQTDRYRRYYYFINSVTQLAPSSSQLNVKIDSWITFINNVNISYMMLERGHAPMSITDVDSYLKNPLNNNKFLLAPDVDFSNNFDIVKTSDFIPVNNGTKYILISSTMSVDYIKSYIIPTKLSNTNTPATYSDSSSRNGYQYIVNGYEWNLGGYDLNNSFTDSSPFQSTDNITPNNTCTFAVKAIDASKFFSSISEISPFIFKTFKACYMVDDTMFEKDEEISFFNVSIYTVKEVRDSILYNLSLTRDTFKFDDKYKEITKLYTFPYSRIEVTDNNGNTKSFKIENTSDVKLIKDVSLAFPYLSIQTYLIGINGSGSTSYKWKRLNDSENDKKNYSDDFGEYLWTWDIPTYALYVRGYDVYKSDNFATQTKTRYDAIAEYHRSVASYNTQYQNAVDSANNTYNMSVNSANTEYTNSCNMADTAHQNSYNSAQTGQDNNNASADTEQSNANASANTANANANNNANLIVTNNSVQVGANSTMTNRSNTASVNTTTDNNGLNSATQAWDAGLTYAMTDATNTYTEITGLTNAVTGFANGAISGAVAGGPAGAAIGALTSIPNAIAAGVTTYATISKNSTQASATVSNTQSKVNETNNNNNNVVTETVTCATSNTETHNTAMTTQTENTSGTEKTNAANTNNTAHANAARTRDTSVANAQRTKDTSNTNADNLQSTTKTNAGNTKSNSINNANINRNVLNANSGYTRDTSVTNAQITMEQKRIDNQQIYKAHQLDAPVSYGNNSGDMTLDEMERRGLQIKIRTERDSDISQAGDLMLRFGYYLNQAWDVKKTGLNLMKHYTYWKVADMWINQGEGVNQDSLIDIQDAFFRGVTVWKNPDEIGKVTIYGNRN